MKLRKTLVWILVVAILASSALAGVGRASPGILIYTDPEIVTKEQGETFSIYVTASGVPGDPTPALFLQEFNMSFDPSVLAVVDDPATGTPEDPVIEGVNPGDTEPYLEEIWVEKLDNTEGWVFVTAGRPLEEKRGLGGTVQVAKVTFEVKAEGFCDLELRDTRVKYGKPYSGEDVPHETRDGYFTTELFPYDIAVTEVTVSPSTPAVGKSVSITVVVENEGTETVSFSVTVYCDNTTIGTPQSVDNLETGANTTLTFKWDTSGVTVGEHTVKAEAVITDETVTETDTSDNVRTRIVTVKEASSPNILLYAVVGAVIALVAVVVAVRFLRRGKPKSP